MYFLFCMTVYRGKKKTLVNIFQNRVDEKLIPITSDRSLTRIQPRLTPEHPWAKHKTDFVICTASDFKNYLQHL